MSTQKHSIHLTFFPHSEENWRGGKGVLDVGGNALDLCRQEYLGPPLSSGGFSLLEGARWGWGGSIESLTVGATASFVQMPNQ